MAKNLPDNLAMFEQLPDPKTMEELLARMAVTYEAVVSLVNSTDETGLTSPLEGDGWSIKDHLAHLTAWEWGMVALLQKKDRFSEMGLDETQTDINDHNAVNEALHKIHAERPFGEIYQAFQETHLALLKTLADLSDADLQKPYSHYQPWAQSPATANPVVGWLAGNTYAHYAEHLLEIGRLLD